MDLIHKDFKAGKIKLRVTDLDDLWYLSHLIDPGDLLRGKTTRKIKTGQGENAKTVKKPMTLSIEAETITFSSAGNSLRINGKVKEGPEDVPRDSYHVLELEIGTEIVLEKPQWLSYQKQKLQEASERNYLYLLCLFDREEALFAITKKFGYDILTTLQGEVSKKRKTVEVKKDFQEEIIKIIEQYAQRYQPEHIILASPAFYKDELLKKIPAPELKKKIALAICSDVSERSIDEVMRRPELADVLKNSRARQEQLLMEELLLEIRREKLAAYGKKEVEKAVRAGAVRILLLTDEYVQQQREKGNFAALDDLMKMVDQLQGKVHILSAQSESGRKLNGLGGIAALLRYELSPKR